MEKVFQVLFIVFASLTFAQKNIIDVLIVKKNNDSLKAKMLISMSNYKGKVYVSEIDFFKKINIVDSSGNSLFFLSQIK